MATVLYLSLDYYVYTGHVHDRDGGTTCCPHCQAALIVRDWNEIRD